MFNLIAVHIMWIIRDRIFQALIGVSVLLIMLVPVMSAFSMRQSQELATTLSLSFISFTQMIYAVLLGSTLIWRDIERRYTYSVTSLPISRDEYIIAKFLAISVFIWCSSLFIGLCGAVAIKLGAMQYISMNPIQWGPILLALLMTALKCNILTALALLVSTVSTSFFMPFFTSIAIYLAGSASQEVYEYIVSDYGKKFSEVSRLLVMTVYYVIPNFGAFDYTLQAVYPIQLDIQGVVLTVLYGIVYCVIAIALSVIVFSKRELI
jgi:ABC-type transport system involved in multi-copper enzyme maturation permease subunit